ncbi:MAG TPA: hypothetical protein V6C88_15005, partial [Chroococcidiopsis sp.]
MAKTVEQIERDIAALNQLLERLAQELQNTYQHYLVTLGRGLRQQLILACYHLCTQGYPNEFLALSFSQRQALQQALQTLARQTQAQLGIWLDPSAVSPLPAVEVESVQSEIPANLQLDTPENSPANPPENSPENSPTHSEEDGDRHDSAGLRAEIAASIGAKLEAIGIEMGIEMGDRPFDQATILAIIAAPELTDADASAESDTNSEDNSGANPDSSSDSNSASNSGSNSEDGAEGDRPSHSDIAPPPAKRSPLPKRPVFDPLSITQVKTPQELARWHDGMEHRIGEVLLEVSHQANRLLQQAGLLPNQLPEPIFEVAAKAGMAMEATAGPPNLLNLVLEIESKDG